MRRLVLRIALGLVALVATSLVVAIAVAEARWDRTFDAPAAPVAIRATSDPAMIARGRYIAYGPGKCVDCHASPERDADAHAGRTPPLAGGREFAVFGGTFRVPNITNDTLTGIGRYGDAQLARAIRYGVRHDGRALLPFMAFQGLADDDITAILSFLRSEPGVRHAVPDHDAATIASKAILAFLMKPESAAVRPPVRAPQGATVERGAYLVRSLANCVECHTARSPVDGSFTGVPLAGGMRMDHDGDSTRVLVTPNLTPDTATGRIARWSEAQFVARLRAGRTVAASHMPWESFGRMTDDDLRAIYRYLRSVPPAHNATGESVQAKE